MYIYMLYTEPLSPAWGVHGWRHTWGWDLGDLEDLGGPYQSTVMGAHMIIVTL